MGRSGTNGWNKKDNALNEEKKAIYYGKITEGKLNGYGKKEDLESYIKYESNFIKGKKWGHGKELESSYLSYEGEFSDDKRNGYGKKYDFEKNIIFEGQFLDGKRWEGFGKEFGYITSFEGEYKNNRYWNGKEFIYDLWFLIYELFYSEGEKQR